MKSVNETIISSVLTYDQVIVRTATSSTLKVAANLAQILNFKGNFHTKIKVFSKKYGTCDQTLLLDHTRGIFKCDY